jgi:hypothetical protein
MSAVRAIPSAANSLAIGDNASMGRGAYRSMRHHGRGGFPKA